MVGSKVMKGYMESLLSGELDAAGYPKIGGASASAPASEASESTESADSSESTDSSEEQQNK